MTTIDISDENFKHVVVESRRVSIIDFGAEWCAPYRGMKPAMELLADQFDGKAIIGKLDVDTNPETTAKFGIRNLPTFLFFKDGELVGRIVGSVRNRFSSKN